MQSLTSFRLFGGLNAKQLWPVVNFALPAWVLLAVAPRWKYTEKVTLIPPLIEAIVYSGSLLSLMFFAPQKQQVDFASMGTFEGVVNLFKDPDSVFVGWVHYVCFDLLVGRGIVMDSQQLGVSDLQHAIAVVPCLFFTLMTGPFGYLSYLAVRATGALGK